MANPLPPPLATGTLGEILVQLRLLQFGVQAAPPIKDTGNDLVAFKCRAVRTLQVKTSANRIPRDRKLPNHYDILALVQLDTSGGIVSLDLSRVFLIPHVLASYTPRTLGGVAQHELTHDNVDRSMDLLDRLFSPDGR